MNWEWLNGETLHQFLGLLADVLMLVMLLALMAWVGALHKKVTALEMRELGRTQ